MANEGRGVFRMIWRNFIQSITAKSRKGTAIGTDNFGTTYYEIPADPQGGKRRPVRWFETKIKEQFDQEIPAEWESWLRGRRRDPPSQEEIEANVAVAQMKKLKAAQLALKEDQRNPQEQASSCDGSQLEKPAGKFPVYEEYEVFPNSKKQT